MFYNLVSSAEIVARISEDYNINYSDYINRVPQWVHQALNELNVKIAFIPTNIDIPIVDRIGILPKDIKVMLGVECDGVRLRRIDGTSRKLGTELNYNDAIVMTNIATSIYGTDTSISNDGVITTTPDKIRTFNNETIIEAPISQQYDYLLLPNGKIEVNKDCDNITVYYMQYPIQFDDVFGFEAPMIPDNEPTKVALTWYVLSKILMRGYKHPILQLSHRDVEFDPYKQWDVWKTKARNNLSDGDSERNDIISRIWNSYFYLSTFV